MEYYDDADDADDAVDADDGTYITVVDAAARAGVHRTTVTQWGRSGRVRTVTTTVDRSGRARRVYHAGDIDSIASSGSRDSVAETEQGNVVYVILLDPERRPTRVKVGTTLDLPGRARAFRTTCPELRILRTFDVPPSCEGFALTLAERLSDKSMSEVFDFTEEGLSAFLDHLALAFDPLTVDE